jgi:SAM-dependent methyltransferase
LPLSNDAVDAVVLGFLLNHLADPAAALAEAARVVRPGGWVLASTWARENDHPVKHLVEAALVDRGWAAPSWYVQLKQETALLTDSATGLAAAAQRAGLAAIDAQRVDVPVSLTSTDLVRWRLGLPQCAPFVGSLPTGDRAALLAELTLAATRLPPLVCGTVMLVARVPG